MQKLQKIEDTWYGILENSVCNFPCGCKPRFQIRFNPESIQRAVARMMSHIILRNPNGNRYALYLYRNDDGRWNWNCNWLDNNRDSANPSVVLATLFISLLTFCRESFVFGVVLSIRRAFCRSHSSVRKAQYIFYRRETLFPKESSAIFSAYQLFVLPTAHTAVFPFEKEMRRLRRILSLL